MGGGEGGDGAVCGGGREGWRSNTPGAPGEQTRASSDGVKGWGEEGRRAQEESGACAIKSPRTARSPAVESADRGAG